MHLRQRPVDAADRDVPRSIAQRENKKPGGVTPSDELKKALIEHCKGKIAVYKLPREIEFIDAMPRTAVGKLLRRILRQQEIDKAKK